MFFAVYIVFDLFFYKAELLKRNAEKKTPG